MAQGKAYRYIDEALLLAVTATIGADSQRLPEISYTAARHLSMVVDFAGSVDCRNRLGSHWGARDREVDLLG
jgi:hypothetical protein